MDLGFAFKCQDCGSHVSALTQEDETGRMICADRETCAVIDALEPTPKEERR